MSSHGLLVGAKPPQMAFTTSWPECDAPIMDNLAVASDEERSSRQRGWRGDLHDLGNFLQVAIAATGLLDRSSASASRPSADQLLSGAREALGRASELTRTLLSASTSTTSETVDVATTLDFLVWQATALSPRGVTVERLTLSDQIEVCCDRLALESALLNLVVNAVQAVGETGTVRLGAFVDPLDNQDTVTLFVEDDGVGMEEVVKRRLFTVGTTSKPRGHGLGMAGVREFAHAASGQVAVRSAPGEGCRIAITLPIQNLQRSSMA